MRAALICMVCVLAVGCGKDSFTTEATSESRPGAKSGKEKPSPKTTPRDWATDFEALKSYCEESSKAIRDEHQANPIRGDELAKKKLDEFRSALVGKTVRWQMPVQDISAPYVSLRAYHYTEAIVGGQKTDFTHLSVRFKEPEQFFGSDWKANPYYTLNNVTQDKARTLTRGQNTSVTGTVKDVTTIAVTTFVIDVRGAKIE